MITLVYQKGRTDQGANRSGRPPVPGAPRTFEKIQRYLLEFAKLMADTYNFPGHDPRFPGCYQLLIDIAKDPKASAAIKVAALAAASKVEPKYLHTPVDDFPAERSIPVLEEYKLIVARRESLNQIDRETASRIYSRCDSLMNDIRADMSSARADAELEIKRLNSEVSDRPQQIIVTGGLPTLPGTNITMPDLNGHATIDPNGNLIPPESPNQEPRAAIPGDGSLPMREYSPYPPGFHKPAKDRW